ncbi:adenosylcobinamide-phosphate synthase CbiB [Thiohalorhabdus methylotrophus]|uniref:Cobalamin biosynthesis protein CobD n=1 Tax=Thiohalorhabdus methylotrophus TaxID=3242694 RepID=A0ABV4TTG1_9GAMM
MTLLAVVLAGLLLDALLGDPRRRHPLAAFGALAARVERRLNRGAGRRFRGLVALLLLVLPFVLVAWWLGRLPVAGPLLAVVLFYLAFGGRSLAEHARAVAGPLAAGDLEAARRSVGLLVSRDTERMSGAEAARATVESVLENGSDAVFASLFWLLVLGPGGVVLHRLVNTLDAMWGYRTARFRGFGWAAARLDDLLNAPPALLTALTYSLLGRTGAALRSWWTQAGTWKSWNAGMVMAAGAGALGVRLGGAAAYHGAAEARPPLGEGGEPDATTIHAAVALVRRGVALWVGLLAAGVLVLD